MYGVNGQTGDDLLNVLLCDDAVLRALHVDGSPNAAPVCKWTFESPLDYKQVNVGCRYERRKAAPPARAPAPLPPSSPGDRSLGRRLFHARWALRPHPFHGKGRT